MHDVQLTSPNEFDEPLNVFLAHLSGWQVVVLSEILRVTSEWIALKFGTDFNVSLMMDCNKFGDPSTFHLPPSLGQNYNFCVRIVISMVILALSLKHSCVAV